MRRFCLRVQLNMQTYPRFMRLFGNIVLALVVATTTTAHAKSSSAPRAAIAETPAPLKHAVTDEDTVAVETQVSLAAWALRAAREQAAAAIGIATRVEVKLFDVNQQAAASVWIGLDGSIDDATAKEITELFMCRRSGRQRSIDRGTLAMLADVAAHYPGKTIEYVSVYRGNAEESRTSPHRAGRAIDFRVHGVNPTEIRDYLWRTYREVGIGWYPQESFIHMDHRPGEKDISWTFIKGDNIYNPGWAAVARSKDGKTPPVRREPGV